MTKIEWNYKWLEWCIEFKCPTCHTDCSIDDNDYEDGKYKTDCCGNEFIFDKKEVKVTTLNTNTEDRK